VRPASHLRGDRSGVRCDSGWHRVVGRKLLPALALTLAVTELEPVLGERQFEYVRASGHTCWDCGLCSELVFHKNRCIDCHPVPLVAPDELCDPYETLLFLAGERPALVAARRRRGGSS